MFRTVIIDDEKSSVEVLELLLKKKFKDIDIVGKFTSAPQGLEYLKKNEVDLVFLDVEMPYLNGFDILNRFDTRTFNVIFVTAYDKYAIQAIRHQALDYLMKPIDVDQLKSAIDKLRRKHRDELVVRQLAKLVQSYNPEEDVTEQTQRLVRSYPKTKVAVGFQDRIAFYEPDEIKYCQSNDNYTNIVLRNGEKVLASKTIKYFESVLSSSGFIRTHQSFLVNAKLVKQYTKKDGGFLVLDDGTNIPVSRNRKEHVLQLFKGGLVEAN